MRPSEIDNLFVEAVRLHQSGRPADAEERYRRVLAARPKHADALHLLGVLCAQRREFDEAIRLIREAVAVQPQAAAYHNNLGNALKDAGRLAECVDAFRRAVDLQPAHIGAWANLGFALSSLGRLDGAIDAYRRALALKPPAAATGPQASAFTRMRNDLAVALAKSGRPDEAAAELRQALADEPTNADAHNNLGLIFAQQGRLNEAIASGRRATELKPDFAAAFSNLGITLTKAGRRDEAVAAYRRSLELAPRNVRTLVNLAHTLIETGDMDGAIAAAESAREIAPDFGGAYQVLGSALRDCARLDESLAAFDRAVELEPQNPLPHSGRIFARHFHAGSDAASQAADQTLWQERHARPFEPHAPHANDRTPDRPLRIGYVSPDFTQHVLALLMMPLFAAHDRSAFHLYLYSDVTKPQPVTDRFKALAHQWRHVAGMSDARLAELIREDRIDILVDLTMHMHGNRLPVFARKPAPVQVTWCYPGSTGLRAIDYRITDPHLDPPGLFDAFYSEESVRLPDTFFCIDPMSDGLVMPPPCLANGHVTFGCLNNFCKVNDRVLRVWARVMRETPGSRLLLLSPRGRHREWVEQTFAGEGIAADRIEHVDRRPRPQYLELYHRIDVSLDTFPYNGHTTSLDSFWMGVPVVTMVGDTVVGRAGLGELTNLGLADLATYGEGQFVDIATRLSVDRDRLASLRAELRERMRRSPLMDGPRFARNMEAAYRTMWRRWCERT